ncbi:MAG: hypothetical protein KA224_02540, partial [Steroidobacteraceae bacterium]|nr:hypothetical protein [Steroidobacteraceae bacterium]
VTTVPIRFTTLAIDAAGLADANTVKVEGADATNTIRDSANAADVLQRLVTLLEPAGGSPSEFRFSLDALRHMPTLIWGAERANFTTAGSFGQYVPANVTFFGGTAGTFSAGRPEVNTTHAAGTAWNSGAIGAATLAADTITAAKIAADAIGASELAADAVAEIQSGLATASNLAIVAGYLDTEVAAIKAKTDNLPSDPADASDIATAFGTVNATLATIDARIDTEVPQIKQVTDKLHSMLEAASGSPGESRFTADALRNVPASSGGASAAAIAAAVWEEPLSGHAAAGNGAQVLQDLSGPTNIAAFVWNYSPLDVSGGSLGETLALASVDAQLARQVAQKVDTTLQIASGSPGDYEFRADALRNTPASSGGASAAAIADAVWDEAIAGHLTSGTTGAALNAAGSAGDPWSTALPGAYGAGTAGYIVGGLLQAQAGRFLSMVEVASGSPGDYKFTADALRAVIGIVPTAIENADALLDRDLSAVNDSNARSPLNALRFLRNKWSISGATLTVRKEDDTTAAWTATVSTTAGADPVTGNDPA